MQIIPVLDIKEGIVVHAQGGNRAHYQAIQSVFTQAVVPCDVLRDLLTAHHFNTVYIADLDAIEGIGTNTTHVMNMLKTFPELEVWLDAGIRNKADLECLPENVNLKPIIASETLREIELFNSFANDRWILSLDKKHGELQAQVDVMSVVESWPQKVIAMDIDQVGSEAGPALNWIQQIRAQHREVELYAAGGVRNQSDIALLEKNKVTGALVATALHNGSLTRYLSECRT